MHVNPVFIGNIDRQQEIAFNLVPKEWALRKLMYRNVCTTGKKKKKRPTKKWKFLDNFEINYCLFTNCILINAFKKPDFVNYPTCRKLT